MAPFCGSCRVGVGMVASKFGLGTEGAGMCNDGDYEHGDWGSLEL